LQEANRVIRESQGPALPTMPTSTIPHERPEMALPDTKRQRLQEMPTGQGSVISAPPTMYPQHSTNAMEAAAPTKVIPVAQAPMPATDIFGNVITDAASGVAPTMETQTNIEQTLMPEEDFIASLSDTIVKLSIRIPEDSSSQSAAWGLRGQTLELSVDVKSMVRSIKEELKSMLGGMPVNKMQLKRSQGGFLKDTNTLAYLNIGPKGMLDMVPKTRGGRK